MDINSKAAWPVGETGDERTRAPLVAALDDCDAHVRVAAIQALVRLNAIDALPIGPEDAAAAVDASAG